MIDQYAIFRSGELGSIIPPAPASPDAQSVNTGGPLNIRHIRRGVAWALLGKDAVVTSTSWIPVWSVTVSTSGRPVLMEASFIASMETGRLSYSFSVDGVEVTGKTYGLGSTDFLYVYNDPATGYLYPPYNMHPVWMAEPGAGTHTISLVAKASPQGGYSGWGTLFGGTNDAAILIAREV